MIAVDEGIGEIIKLLKEKGLYENTLIAVMGDNGFAFGEHGLIDKRTAYEESNACSARNAASGSFEAEYKS